MRYPDRDSILWQFDTCRFRVICHAEHEDLNPADCFELEEDIEAVRAGRVAWFCAFVSVWVQDPITDGIDASANWGQGNLRYVAHDVLGGCAYKRASDFVDHKHAGYFQDMVHEAVRQARRTLKRTAGTELREVA